MNEKRRDIIIGRTCAILSALGYGMGSVLNRQGIILLTTPLVAASVSTLAGTLAMGILAGRRLEGNLRNKKRAVFFYFLAGLSSGLGALSSFFALSTTPVVIASPIHNTYPLFALFFSQIFISRLEKISLRLVVGTVFVVGGVVLITLGRGG